MLSQRVKARNMLGVPLEYEGGYKYRVKAPRNLPGGVGAVIQTGITGFYRTVYDPIYTDRPWAVLQKDGVMTIYVGTAWDGPSGPAFDTPNLMLPSLPHDMFYRLLELKLLPMRLRKLMDLMMLDLCEETGMSWTRRHIDYWGVRLGGRVRMWWRARTRH